MNCRAWLVAALVLFLPAAYAVESGYTVKPTELKDKPFLDAATVVTLPEKTQVEIVIKGMMKQLRNEAEFAGVLGHEVAHVTQKHHLKALRKAAVVNLLSAGAAAATADSRHAELVQKLSGPTKELYARGLDKADEFEADRIGVVLSTRAGYDPYGLPAVLTTLASADPKLQHTSR